MSNLQCDTGFVFPAMVGGYISDYTGICKVDPHLYASTCTRFNIKAHTGVHLASRGPPVPEDNETVQPIMKQTSQGCPRQKMNAYNSWTKGVVRNNAIPCFNPDISSINIR